jgi:hypothetical protein
MFVIKDNWAKLNKTKTTSRVSQEEMKITVLGRGLNNRGEISIISRGSSRRKEAVYNV